MATEPRPHRAPEEPDLRASTPTGPVEYRRGQRGIPIPTLQEARETVLNFGKFHGYTLGEVEILDPAYIDWIARTITRDRDMVIRARLIEEEMDRTGVEGRHGRRRLGLMPQPPPADLLTKTKMMTTGAGSSCYSARFSPRGGLHVAVVVPAS